MLSWRNGESCRSLSFVGRDFFWFSKQIELPKEFCSDALNRWLLDFSVSVQLRALFCLVLIMSRNRKTCHVALSSLVHFENLSTSMTAFTGCCIVVTFVLSSLSILFELSFGSNKNEGGVSRSSCLLVQKRGCRQPKFWQLIWINTTRHVIGRVILATDVMPAIR